MVAMACLEDELQWPWRIRENQQGVLIELLECALDNLTVGQTNNEERLAVQCLP